MNRRKVVIIIGTRPEAIKMAAVVRELERQRSSFNYTLVTTAQHREMLDQVLSVFGLKTDIDLGLMEQNQGLTDFASRSLQALSAMLAELKPDVVLIQGDTTTVMTAALAAFYEGIRVGHVEAGLRSFDRANPFPEEINRCIADRVSDWLFAPTERARLNLLREGLPDETIYVTGNTAVDALKSIELDEHFDDQALAHIDFNNRLLLVTAHRRENHGKRLRSICGALRALAAAFTDVEIIYPMHLNPSVQAVVREELDGTARIYLVAPVSYKDMLRLMKRCYLILTDSGGIQEEAPSFGKPVLVLREVTERPEIIEANAGMVVGTDTNRIVEEATRLLGDKREYGAMIARENPFGDGHAAERIIKILVQQL